MNSWSIFDLPAKESELNMLQMKSQSTELWDNRDEAMKIMKSLSDLNEEIGSWKSLKRRAEDALELAQMQDESLRDELLQEIETLESQISQNELSVLLSGPYDKGNALLAIHSGAGGLDSADWAGMLRRMFLRWAERKGYETDVLDTTETEEGGIKSITIAVNGRFAYGYLKSEKGVHRLVRLSPFDAAHRRHTSFALVEVLPDISKEDSEIQIPQEDIRIDVFKSSGAGGQNVQKNATAIRITHIPTGMVVTCQNERSQMQNRENALRVLRSRLLQKQQEEQAKEITDLRGEYTKAEWGNQIRSYVLHPYQMVKDHRTEFEIGNTQAVLDGDLDDFIEAYLRNNK